MGGGSSLPYDAEIEYLQSTGTQYIDTGITGVTTSDEFYLNATREENSATCAMGMVWSNYYATLTTCHGSKKNVELAWGYVGNAVNTSLPSISEFHEYSTEVVNGNVYFKLDGTSVGSKAAFSNANNYHCLLFCRSSNGSPQNKSKMKVKSFKFWRNGSLVFDGKPVRVGQVGYLYDNVSGTLFGNLGTGNFVLGNDLQL